MEIEIYADLLFLINTGMDGLCLLLTGRLLHRRVRLWRLLTAAALGGVYAVAVLLLPDMGQAPSLLLDLVVCIAMCGLVFGERSQGGLRRLPAAAGVYFLLSMTLGGVMTALYSLLNRTGLPSLLSELTGGAGDGPGSWLFLLLALLGGGVALWGGRLAGHSRAVSVCTVTVELHGKSVRLRGLVDSGNLLRDPMGGRAVICAEEKALEAVLSKPLFEVLRGRSPSLASLSPSDARRLRVIPAQTATGEGLLYGFLPDRVTIAAEGKAPPKVVDAAIALTSIPTPGAEALVPTQLIR
ncbi:MAG: sigma-E processing peptidase SpoIIGA [Clostridia bacterium]|nr:sigma-E processing peptidase SpoIIGA [Clostridia bacterium]